MGTDCKMFYRRESFTGVFKKESGKSLFRRGLVLKVYKRVKQDLVFREVRPCGA